MSEPVKKKQSLYFPEEILSEIAAEATRLDRSLSWVVQRAWRTARSEIRRFQAPGQFLGAGDKDQVMK